MTICTVIEVSGPCTDYLTITMPPQPEAVAVDAVVDLGVSVDVFTGLMGPMGPQGPPGMDGAPGAPGAPGAQGPQGAMNWRGGYLTGQPDYFYRKDDGVQFFGSTYVATRDIMNVDPWPGTIGGPWDTVALKGNTGATGATGPPGPPGTNATAHILLPFSRASVQSVAAGTQRLYIERAMTISHVRASVGTAPTGAALIVDVNKNGTTIFTNQANRPSIAASGFTALAPAIDVTALAAGDYLTVDVDQIGSAVAGSDLVVTVEVVE